MSFETETDATEPLDEHEHDDLLRRRTFEEPRAVTVTMSLALEIELDHDEEGSSFVIRTAKGLGLKTNDPDTVRFADDVDLFEDLDADALLPDAIRQTFRRASAGNRAEPDVLKDKVEQIRALE